MAEIPTIEPRVIRAGDTISWKKTLPDYPASGGYALSYRFISSAGAINISSSASGDDHLISITAATSAAYAAGDYTWFAFITKGAERYTIASGTITILPDIATATEFRTPAKIALDSLNNALEIYGHKAYTQEYQIAGRTMSFKSNDDFMKMRSLLIVEVQREEAAEKIRQGLDSGRRVGVRFNRV